MPPPPLVTEQFNKVCAREWNSRDVSSLTNRVTDLSVLFFILTYNPLTYFQNHALCPSLAPLQTANDPSETVFLSVL
uniref:Uncharacterized protein n=1 Tax=Steinernema glaseri TaxID=37863 RepID=A0A1I7ZAH9_9BILA